VEKLSFNAGDAIHLLEVVVILVGMGAAYDKLQAAADQVANHSRQLDRIEHYLSSRDPEYWQRTRESIR
jgi:hypothetical protein